MSEQQKLISVHFHKLKNLRDLEIRFDGNPVVGIFGPNGCGKSTILHALACLYHPKSGKIEDMYKFSAFFKSDEFTNWRGSKISFEYYCRNEREARVYQKSYEKKKDRWIKEYKIRPDRDIFFIGLKSCVPDIELENTNMATVRTTRDAETISNASKIMQDASLIMGRRYVDLFNSKNLDDKKYLSVENDNALRYKSLSMGAGEQRIFKILRTIHDAPKYSLILIDEIDLTLHASALEMLMNRIVSIAHDMHLQVVFTSHREELMMRLDIDVRHIFQTPQKTFCLKDTTPACIDRMTGKMSRPLEIYVEDKVSKAIISKLLLKKSINRRAAIEQFGSISNAFSVASGLFLSDKLNDNIAIITDGDKYINHEEKIEQLKKHLSGTEEDVAANRERVCSHILQYHVAREHISPELYIWETLSHSERDNEIVAAAKEISFVNDNHHYVTEIIEKLGLNYDVGLAEVVDEFAENEDAWNSYVEEVSNWLTLRIEALHLYNMRTFNLKTLDLIGGGGNSIVYRPNPAMVACNGFVVKVPKYNKHLVDDIQNKHRLLIGLEIPTLSSIDLCVVDGTEALLCEDISSGEKIYVSPHSVETREARESREAVERLDIGYRFDTHVDNLCEQALYESKIDNISNINEFLAHIKNDLRKLAENNVYVESDSYFFGLKKEERVVAVDYKLADLDNIYQQENVDHLLQVNIKQFKEAFTDFINKFVVEENKQRLKDTLIIFNWD